MGDCLQCTWNGLHQGDPTAWFDNCPIPNLKARAVDVYLASVVPAQTRLWQNYPQVEVLSLDRIPLRGLYDSLGIDRALAVLGLGAIAQFPALAIDGGTALTFTGVDGGRRLAGGAILPGLGLQRSCLQKGTAALPEIAAAKSLPPRWAVTTEGAIASGTLYGLVAAIGDFVQDWLASFPKGAIALTGGDSALLYRGLQQHLPNYARRIHLEPHLIFYGMRELVLNRKRK